MPTQIPTVVERRFLTLMDRMERAQASEITRLQMQVTKLTEALDRERTARGALDERRQIQIKMLETTVSSQGEILTTLLPRLETLTRSVANLSTSLTSFLPPVDSQD